MRSHDVGLAGSAGVAGGPLVVVSGWTASGKSTLAASMSDEGLTRVTASSVLLSLLGDRGAGKAARLRSWLSPLVEGVPRTGTVDQLADLAMLRLLARRDGGIVVESAGSLPLLLSPYNNALLIRLDAAPRIRAARVRRFLGDDVDPRDAVRIVGRKDAATACASLKSWGLQLNNPVHCRRYDLALGCPDTEVCRDPGMCARAVEELAAAACRVYSGYLTADGAALRSASEQFGVVLDRFRPWVHRVCSTLLAPADSVTPERWQERLAHHIATVDDGERRGASC